MGWDWQRLADHLHAAMTRQKLTPSDIEAETGVSVRTVQRLLSGEPRTRIPESVFKIEVALDWAPGTARHILDGGSPDDRPADLSTPHFDDPDEQTIWDAGERNGWPVDKRQYLIDSLRALKRVQRGA